MLRSDFRKKAVCSKSVTKTLYRNKFLVSEYIFKLVYHCEGSRRSEICCARNTAAKSLNRLLLLLILKSSYRRCTVEKGALKNFAGKHPCWSLFLNKVVGLTAFNVIKKRFQCRCFLMRCAKFLRTPILKNICERLLLYPYVILFTMHEKDTANEALLEPS